MAIWRPNMTIRIKAGRACMLIAVLAVLVSGTSASAGTSVNTGYFGGVAIKGYDPVAYFTETTRLPDRPSSVMNGSAQPGSSRTPSIGNSLPRIR
jgi:hypothetical protein